MRTVINIKSGGRTPLAGMTHSLVLLLLLLGAAPLAESIPHALLAGILIKVELDIIDWGFLHRAHRLSVKTALVMWGVLLLTVFWDLIGAVLIGMFVANLLTIRCSPPTSWPAWAGRNATPSLRTNNSCSINAATT